MTSLTISDRPPSGPFRSAPAASSAFSLTELLTAIAIIALLATASGPVITSLSRNGYVGESTRTLHGLMEGARQEAITRNTPVWLAIGDAASSGEPIRVALIASRTGDDPLGWDTDLSSSTDLSTYRELELIGGIRKLTGVRVVEQGEVTFDGLKSVVASPFEPVAWSLPSGGEQVTFNRAIRFSPGGEAQVKSFARVLEVGLVPALGGSENSAVMRTAALTGKTTVFRPQ